MLLPCGEKYGMIEPSVCKGGFFTVLPPSAMITFWIVALVVFLIIEAVTAGLVSIWFVFGSLVALLCAALGAAAWLQIVWFAVVSVATLILTRPLVKKYVNSRGEATNADRSIGRTAVVTERIDNLAATGAVQLDGVVWTARSIDDAVTVEAGAHVTVCAIEGVKLIVERTE